jgi:myosin-crossreactive antigen
VIKNGANAKVKYDGSENINTDLIDVYGSMPDEKNPMMEIPINEVTKNVIKFSRLIKFGINFFSILKLAAHNIKEISNRLPKNLPVSKLYFVYEKDACKSRNNIIPKEVNDTLLINTILYIFIFLKFNAL